VPTNDPSPKQDASNPHSPSDFFEIIFRILYSPGWPLSLKFSYQKFVCIPLPFVLHALSFSFSLIIQIIIGKEYKLGTFQVRSSHFILVTSSPFCPNTAFCVLFSNTFRLNSPNKTYIIMKIYFL
jgi:hypothetical protein